MRISSLQIFYLLTKYIDSSSLKAGEAGNILLNILEREMGRTRNWEREMGRTREIGRYWRNQ